MKKNFLITLLIICGFCCLILLNACATINVTPNETNQNSEEFNVDDAADDNSYDSNQINLNSLYATLIGGGCSIVGGALGAIITVIATKKSDKTKRKIQYFEEYYSLLHKTQLVIKKIGESNFNAQECKRIVNEFIATIEKDDNLFLNTEMYYLNGYQKLKNILENILKQISQQDLNATTLYKVLFKAFSKEKKNVQKYLN